jgi:methionine-rich copper-binding protein CopC
MENASGRRFGQTIWVGITTLVAQATPVATQQSGGNTCVVTLTQPTQILTAGADFETIWTVKNTSGSDWSMNSVDYMFLSGTQMHQKAVYDFTQTIKDGESGQIIVNMVAPNTPGNYTAEWAVVSSNTTLCILNVTVTVK